MKQLSKKEAVAFAENEAWKEWDHEQVVRFQLFQKKLCVDFGRFHEALENVLGRPVWTHELGMNYQGIVEEYLGMREKPSFEDILEMIPEEKRIIIGI